jgi:hypothetical protein
MTTEKLATIFGALVPTFFTTTGGVSLSEVARRQAEHKQLNDVFWGRVTESVGGVFRKIVSFVGAGATGTPQTVDSPTISPEELSSCFQVGERNAETAVLMHGVKLWKNLEAQLQVMDLQSFVVASFPEAPMRRPLPEAPKAPKRGESGTVCSTGEFMDLANIDQMIANLKTAVLAKFDFAFWQRANQLNARAAAIGKLLSEQGSFFREITKPLPKGSDQVTQTGVAIFRWEKSYSEEQIAAFATLRDSLQAEYNDLQKQLNGLKKQVKDAVRAYNLDVERQYQVAYGEYQLTHASYQAAVNEIQTKYQEELTKHAQEMERIRASAETLRQEALAELATLRVRTE